jgi:hypothetical protein
LKTFAIEDPGLRSSVDVFFHLFHVIHIYTNEQTTWATAIWKAVVDFEQQAEVATAWPECAHAASASVLIADMRRPRSLAIVDPKRPEGAQQEPTAEDPSADESAQDHNSRALKPGHSQSSFGR